MTPAPQHEEHAPGDLCRAGTRLYERALREGHLTAEEAREAPCLTDTGLVEPATGDPGRLEPVAPVLALPRLLRRTAERIAEERRGQEHLTEVFRSFMAIGGGRTDSGPEPVLRVLGGTDRINEAITEAEAEARQEMLCVQPNVHYRDGKGERSQAISLGRDQDLLDRGGRIRTLYQHTQRHLPLIRARYEKLRGDVEVRTLDELADRLIVLDRTVAFMPANADRTMALEIRHPALVQYLCTAFDRFWRLATPMYPKAVQPPSPEGITARQRAIAELLIEGHTDTAIAERLGLNVRTARVHIAKLAATLGSQSRAQLGYLIGRSGILDRGR